MNVWVKIATLVVGVLVALSVAAGATYGVVYGAAIAAVFVGGAAKDEASFVGAVDKSLQRKLLLAANILFPLGMLLFLIGILIAPAAATVAVAWTVIGIFGGIYLSEFLV